MSAAVEAGYQPRANGLASLLIGFFENNPGEFLTLEDVADKFAARTGDIRKALKLSVDAGLLRAERDAAGNHIYKRGLTCAPDSYLTEALEPDETLTSQGAVVKRITANGMTRVSITPIVATETRQEIDPMPKLTAIGDATPKEAATPRASTRRMFDLETLIVVDSVPWLGAQAKGLSKWDPLFAKLEKPGQSLQIPGDCRSTLDAAARNQNKKNAGTFKVAAVAGGFARVWRVA